MEHGATRNFESLRRLQEKITRENKEEEEEEIANPMKVCLFTISIVLNFYSNNTNELFPD